MYTAEYYSPLGKILISSDGDGITGLWFYGARHFGSVLDKENIPKRTADIEMAEKWLDIYFSGKKPDFLPPLKLIGTPFRQMVWKMLLEIPYGYTVTYGQVAAMVCKDAGLDSMSARAVGGAVGHNPVSVIVPCHRVIGSGGRLCGYAGGIDKKKKLLKLEEGPHNTIYEIR